MDTYKTHIEPQSCFVFAHFDNGDSIQTSVNPNLSDEEIFSHHFGRSFSFARYNDEGKYFEVSTKVVRLLITRKEKSNFVAGDELPVPPTSISIFDQEAV